MDDHELEYRLLYSIVVAGKNADFARNALRKFLSNAKAGVGPFTYLERLNETRSIGTKIRDARMGNYLRLERAFTDIVYRKLQGRSIDLRACAPVDLEAIHGIGPKTARFFIIWTRPGARCAALDTHVLKWMSYAGYSVPKRTPQSRIKYAELEEVFIREAYRRGETPRSLDALIWDWCRRGFHKTGEWPLLLIPGTPIVLERDWTPMQEPPNVRHDPDSSILARASGEGQEKPAVLLDVRPPA